MGANIKISSDSKQFINEINQVTQSLKLMESEMGVVVTKSELFGKEQDKLQARSKELNSSIQGQNTLLNLHKQTISALTGDISKYKDRNTELSKSISEVESKLKESIKSTGEDSKETKALQQELNKLQKEYNANEKAIDKSAKQIDTYKIKMNDTEKAILQSKKALEETDKKLSSMKWDKATKDLDNFGNKTKDIGESLTTKVTLPIIVAGGASVKLASDMSESLNKVDVSFGENADEIKKWSESTLTNFGLAKGTALDVSATYGDMATSMGFATSEASKMAQALVGRAADLSSFKNIRIDIAKTALNGIFSGETESLKQLGVVMTEANLLEYAVSKGLIQNKKDALDVQKANLEHEKAQKAVNDAVNKYGQNSIQAREAKLKLSEVEQKANQSAKASLDTLSQTEKVQLRYNFVMEKTKNAQGDFARTSDGVANSTRVTAETVKELGAEFGQNLLPIVSEILKPLNSLLKSISEMSPEGQKVVLVTAGILAIIPPILIGIGQMSIGISAITGLLGAHAAATTADTVAGATQTAGIFTQIGAWTASKIQLVGTTAAIVAHKVASAASTVAMGTMTAAQWALNVALNANPIGILITGLGLLVGSIVVAYNKSEWFRQKVHEIGAVFRGVIDIMKGFSFPKIKLPHFSVTGEFSLAPPKMPKIGVEYYAEGGIMTAPTLFGMNGSNTMIGGEAGAEGIIPLKTLWNELSKNFDKLEQRLNNNKQQQPIFVTVVSELDGRAIARGTAKYMPDELTYLDKNNNFIFGGV